MSVSQVERDPVIMAEILTEGRELFKRYGFKKTTMEDIAKMVGKSKSALYYYFKTKEEIFEAIIMHDMKQQHQKVAAAVKEASTARDKFRSFVKGMFANVKEKAEDYSVYRAELFESAKRILELTEEKDRFVEHQLKDILLFGISNGEVKQLQSMEMETWVNMIHWGLKQVGMKIFMNNQNDYILDHLDFLADSLFDGVSIR